MVKEDKWGAAPGLVAQNVSKPQINTRAFVQSLIERIRAKTVTPAQAGNIPAGLIYATFNYQYNVPWVIPNTGRTSNPRILLFTPTYTATVFLNNQNNTQGDFQYLLIDNDVNANPTSGSGNFANMFARTPEHQCPGCAYDEIAWSQDQLIADVIPANDVAWELIGTSPETVNGVTEVTAEVNFDIGFNWAEGAKAASVTATL